MPENSRAKSPRISNSYFADRHDLQLLAVAIAAAWIVIAALQLFLSSKPGNDFVQFYAAGQTLNGHGNLYDTAEQQSRISAIQPGRTDVLRFAYSPTLALVFQPFALVPYRAAFALWTAISVLLYGLGLAAFRPLLPERDRGLLLALALAFPAFGYFTLDAGQVSPIAFVLVAWAIRSDIDGKRIRCGALLAACAYKPTMLLIIVPCLLVRANRQVLAGFALSGTATIATTLAILGPDPYLGWAKMLIWYTGFPMLPLFIDLSHFLQRIIGPPGRWLFLLFAIPAATFLLRMWRRSKDLRLLWSLTLAATLLINVYAQSYDGILASAAYLLVYRPENRVVGLVLWIAPLLWLASPVVQPFTVAVALFAAHTLAMSRRSDRCDIASAALVAHGEGVR